MTSGRIRIAVDRDLESVPSIRSILEERDPAFSVRVCDRRQMRTASDDVLLINLDADPAAVLRRLERVRHAVHRAKVLLLSADPGNPYCEDAIIRGGSGIIGTSVDAALIKKAVACIVRGELWLGRQTTGRLFDRLSRGVSKNPTGRELAQC